MVRLPARTRYAVLSLFRFWVRRISLNTAERLPERHTRGCQQRAARWLVQRLRTPPAAARARRTPAAAGSRCLGWAADAKRRAAEWAACVSLLSRAEGRKGVHIDANWFGAPRRKPSLLSYFSCSGAMLCRRGMSPLAVRLACVAAPSHVPWRTLCRQRSVVFCNGSLTCYPLLL